MPYAWTINRNLFSVHEGSRISSRVMNHSIANQSCNSFLVGRGAVLDKVRAIPRVVIIYNLTAKHSYIHAIVT